MPRHPSERAVTVAGEPTESGMGVLGTCADNEGEKKECQFSDFVLLN